MKQMQVDIAVIGGGPAGLAAAIEARRQGVQNVLIIERDRCLGGILQQCIHDGFGLHRFQKRMSGSQYAQKFIDEVIAEKIPALLDTMVLEITPERTIFASNAQDGVLEIRCGAIILAMGCRERTRNQVFIYGTRPSGVLTAGAVQRYINISGYLPGKRAVILGSGDIGLIMARRMTLEGMEVEGVYEVMSTPGGLTRNIVQCLDDYDIPLHLSTTVVEVHGNERVEGVTVAKVTPDGIDQSTRRYIPCDLLVLAVGLIPENELSQGAEIEMSPKTRGPVLDEHFMTSREGIFACGNVAVVFDLVDYVSQTGELTARGAVAYLHGELHPEEPMTDVIVGNNVQFVVPQRYHASTLPEKLPLFMRVKKREERATIVCRDGEKTLFRQTHPVVCPPEMLTAEVSLGDNRPVGPLTVGMEEKNA